MSSRRFGSRSAISPPYGASSSMGRNCRPVVMPTACAEWWVRIGQDQPVLGDPLHPGADVGDDAPDIQSR